MTVAEHLMVCEEMLTSPLLKVPLSLVSPCNIAFCSFIIDAANILVMGVGNSAKEGDPGTIFFFR